MPWAQSARSNYRSLSSWRRLIPALVNLGFQSVVNSRDGELGGCANHACLLILQAALATGALSTCFLHFVDVTLDWFITQAFGLHCEGYRCQTVFNKLPLPLVDELEDGRAMLLLGNE